MSIAEVLPGYILAHFGHTYSDFDLTEWICRRTGESHNLRQICMCME